MIQIIVLVLQPFSIFKISQLIAHGCLSIQQYPDTKEPLKSQVSIIVDGVDKLQCGDGEPQPTLVIPNSHGVLAIPPSVSTIRLDPAHRDRAIYWTMHKQLMGDRQS